MHFIARMWGATKTLFGAVLLAALLAAIGVLIGVWWLILIAAIALACGASMWFLERLTPVSKALRRANGEDSDRLALTTLIGVGELILTRMAKVPGDVFQDMRMAAEAHQWIEITKKVVGEKLGSSYAAEINMTSLASSPTHPHPQDLSNNLVDYWNSVAWRIDRLRIWVDKT